MNATFKVVGLLCAFMAAVACGDQVANGPDRSLPYEKLLVGQHSGAAILEEREEVIKGLLRLAAMPGQGRRHTVGNVEQVEYPLHDAKHLAMLLLGDMRASEGVSVLVENIEYRVPKFMSKGYELGRIEGPGWHPAVESLIKIGMPSVQPAVKRLSGIPTDCLARRLCLVVLKEVLGPRLAKARLEIAIEEAREEAVKTNLKAALGQLETGQGAPEAIKR